MASPGSSSHLIPLVLESKKALQQGEQLCQQASKLSISTSQCSIDVLALDAKIRWMSDAVLDQLQVARHIARSIQDKRAGISSQIEEWDSLRSKHTNDLENVLESLSAQFVPPSFHQPSSENEDETSPFTLTSAVKSDDRSTWKNLRDFVDDNAIDQVLDTIENERLTLEDVFATTEDYDSTLSRTIDMIRTSVEPAESSSTSKIVKVIEDTLTKQDNVKHSMAEHLESLARHYNQMAEALKEAEGGEEFGEEDLMEMNRDTDELPVIISELEESLHAIEESHNALLKHKDVLNGNIENMKAGIDDLDELGDIMGDMLNAQEEVQSECHSHLITLHSHLSTLSSLYESYTAYQLSYSKLVLELHRRRTYTEAAERIVNGMLEQLTAMTLEETRMRAHFTEDYGANIPEDICLCIADMPTKWNILPDNVLSGRSKETLPDLPPDVLAEAKALIGRAEVDGRVSPGMDSL